ncbi:MAG: hypothetical protein JSU04_04460 [Bdellovibrionales bacterium]|nr:hypothetical protein [Bdellovibrionales bacterium]
MKLPIALIVSAFAFSAHALESNYGTLSRQGGQQVCTYTNDGGTKYMKRASFELEGAHGSTYTFETIVNKVVANGETITATSSAPAFYKGWYCKFLSTNVAAPGAPAPN